jgi:hypothetical protein
MLGSWNALGQGWPVACTLALLGLSSCSGAEFTANDGAGGTDASHAGRASAGHDNGGGASGASGATTGGGTSSGGASDVGGSSGVGGTVSGGCECDDGYYCRDGSEDCFDCAELNRLHFATPERLATVSDNGQGSRFPRVGMTFTDLLYRFEGAGLRYTTDASTSAGANVKLTTATDSAPLLLGSDVTGVPAVTLMGFNFVFDREENGLRSLYMGEWSNGLQRIEHVPAPYNGGKNDYSMAIASKPTADSNARAFWMTDRGGTMGMAGPSLVTALLLANAPAAPVNLKLGQEGCGASDPDLAPWVTTDGKTLLVSHTRLDANCKATGQGKDIYTALLQPATGLPTAAAVPMSDVNSPMNDVEPSFSADLCDLYFASDRDGKYALYRAHRR